MSVAPEVMLQAGSAEPAETLAGERSERGRSAGQKLNLYLPIWMSRELENEATRLDRSVSWILRRAWKLARLELQRTARPPAGD